MTWLGIEWFLSNQKGYTLWILELKHMMTSLMDARELPMTSTGTPWDIDHKQLPPVATQFVRMHPAPNMSPPMLQEALTLSTCIDGLLVGRVASTVDVLFQRLKALKNVSRGSLDGGQAAGTCPVGLGRVDRRDRGARRGPASERGVLETQFSPAWLGAGKH